MLVYKMMDTNLVHSRSPRVVIADDHELFRNVLILTLEEAGISVIETVSNGRQAVDSAIKHKPDILTLDIIMPVLDGLAALAIVKHLHPEIHVVVITSAPKVEYLSRAGELGVAAFFSKGVSSELLINTIHTLIDHEPSQIPIQDIDEPTAPSVPCIHFTNKEMDYFNEFNLTEKEGLVLSLISMGYDNKSILEHLFISNNTLKTHMRNIYSKIGVNDRTQAAIWALKNGFGVGISS